MKLTLLICLFFAQIYAGAIVIDHTCTDATKIPQYWIDYVQDNITVHHAGSGNMK